MMILKFWRSIDIYGGYHAYMDTWNPALGQELILKPEPSNYKDKHAVAVLKDDVTVGHVPYNLAPRLSQCLGREVNNVFAEITGEKVRHSGPVSCPLFGIRSCPLLGDCLSNNYMHGKFNPCHEVCPL